MSSHPTVLRDEPITYLTVVPDHHDRIVWRNHYYHLPLDKPARLANLREALTSLLDAVTNSESGEVDKKLAIKDARIALAQT